MKFPFAVFLAFFAVFASPSPAEPFAAFVDGEVYRYRVGWGIFGRAGEITIRANKEVLDGRDVMRISTTTSSRGFVRGVYRYDDSGTVVVDIETGRLVYTEEQSEDSRRKTEARTDFDYEAKVAKHRDKTRPHRNTDLPMPAEGLPIDLISSLVAPRDWGMKPGDKRDILVHFGREFFPLTLHAEAIEKIDTPMGDFNALRIVPRMDKETPRGLFARGGEIKVWISQDEKRLPVRMQLKLKYGTATLLLQEHSITPEAKAEPTASPAAP